ncbi:hypothetical protein [Methanobrevibacter curvatus]|uniref:Uncharacterized protein n=1 Tax=Methanobrevibacter curvatus TaxID=49547 RepID=A0A166CB80_9EURY|nr:hypothetical protein [Methanobrevibacter curvatus]KZX14326.1 hypothetical protein MBCUR_05500 [Methanobrevibacter curvatus]
MDRKKINGIIIAVFLIILACIAVIAITGDNTDSNKKTINTDILKVKNATLENNYNYKNLSNVDDEFSLYYNEDSFIVFIPTFNEYKGYDEYYTGIMKITKYENYDITNVTIAGFKGELLFDSDLNSLEFLFVANDGKRYSISAEHNDILKEFNIEDKNIAKNVFEDVLTAWKTKLN